MEADLFKAIQVGELSSNHGSARCASGHWKKLSEDFFADCEQILGPSFSSFWLIQGCQCRWSKRNPLFPQKWFKSPSLSCHLRFPEWTPTTFQTGYLYRLKIRMMVGWVPTPWFLEGLRQAVPPMLTHELHGAEAFVNPIASRNQHPLHHFLHFQGPDSKLGYGWVYDTMVLHHGISCVFAPP